MVDQDLGRAVLRLTTDPTGLQAGMRASREETASAIQSANAHLRAVGTQLTATGQKLTLGVTLPIVAAGKAIVDVGTDFDTTLRRIVGLAGVSQDAIGGIRERILSLGGEVGKTPQELAEAFYFVASAGFKADEAMDVLETSAKASAAGLGRVQDVAKVLGLTINAYGHENITAARAADILTAAVRDGTAEADAFASVLGRVVPTAAQMGVSFDQVTAALAGMTITGLSADEAATSLNQVLISLLKPTKEAEDALSDMGLSSAKLREELKEKGLLETLRTLETRFDGNEEAAAKVFGNVRALRGALSLLGLDADQLNDIFADTKGALGDLEDGYAATEGPARDMARAQAELDAQLIELSQDVLPEVIELMRSVVAVVKMGVEWFEALPEPVQATVVQFLALVALAGPLLVFAGAVTSAAAATGRLAIAAGPLLPLLLVVADQLGNAKEAADQAALGNDVYEQSIDKLGREAGWMPDWLRDVAVSLGLVHDGAADAAPAIGQVTDVVITAADAAQDAREKMHILAASLPPVEEAYDDLAFTISTWAQQTEEKQSSVLAAQREYTRKALEILQGFRLAVENAYQAATDARLDTERTAVAIETKQAEIAALDAERTKDMGKWTAAQKHEWQLRKDEAIAQLNLLKLHMALIGDDIAVTAKVKAELAGKDMKAGLTSKLPEIQESYRGLRDAYIARLNEIKLKGGPAAKAATEEIAKWMDPSNPLSPLNDADTWGAGAGKAYDKGIAAGILRNMYLVRASLGAMARLLESASPPKSPENPLHHIDKWGDATGDSWVQSLIGSIAGAPAAIKAALGDSAAVLAGGFGPMPGLTAAAQGAGIGGFSRNVPVLPAQASDVAREALAGGRDTFNLFLPDARHTDPWAVLDRMPRYVKQAKAAAGETGWKEA